MSTDFKAGSNIGGYILDSYVGGGSFGAVWRGHDENSGEAVAVKLLTGALSSSETSAMRADVELLAASAASHSQHVVHVLGGGVEPIPHIVMEYVEGHDLAALLKDKGKLSAEETIEVGRAISDALGALNEAGIIHRDIKPANVMMTNDGRIKLADFGIAKIVGYETMTMTGQAAMTMAYAAPEIWDDGSPYGKPSHKSDLYAMGVLLYQCISGETPFRGNYGALYKAHMERSPDIKVLPPETPPSLRTLIQHCLEKRQEDRPTDAIECIQILDRAKTELAGSAMAINEPRQFGPWIKEAPHQSQPWAWYCRHESKDTRATVEVHFADSLDYSANLRRALSANTQLTPFGAERLYETNRLLLHPNERWNNPPAGRFQFWIAREDRDVEPAAIVTTALLATAATSLAALIAAAAKENITLGLRDQVTVLPGGDLHVRRPGLDQAPADMQHDAFEVVRGLPLDSEARALVFGAGSFALLAGQLGALSNDGATVIAGRGDQTVLAGRTGGETVLVGRDAAPAAESPEAIAPLIPARQPDAVSSSPALRMSLAATSAGAASAWYDLSLANQGEAPVELRLHAQDQNNRLAYSMPQQIKVAAGATERVRLHIKPHKRRMFGGKQITPFTILASGSGGSNLPPMITDGEFEDLPSRMPLLGGAGVLGIAALAVAGAAMAMGGGGDGDSNTRKLAAGPDIIETATATASPVPVPTETPVPPPPPPPVVEAPPPPPPPEPNRANCNAIRGTAYQSKTEEEWWAVNCRNTAGGTTGGTGGGTAPAPTWTPVPSTGGGGGAPPPPPPPPPPTATRVPAPAVPAQKTSALVGLTITGGHGSVHRLGATLSLCYTSRANQRIRVYDTRTPGVLMRQGVDDGRGECFSVTTDFVGVDSIRIDAFNAAGTAVADYAQISIVVQ